MAEIGDWVQPSWSGHAHAGSTGQITGVSNNGSWKVDVDGDGQTDYYIANQEAVLDGSYIGSGMLAGHANDSMQSSISIFNVGVTLVLAVVGLAVIKTMLKRFKIR